MIERTYQVGVYIRLSREDGDDRESESVENQRDIINNFIEQQEDLEFIEEYVDDGYTGTNFNRPSFKKMIEDVNKGKITCIITKDLSRFGRDHIETGYYLEKYLPANNIRYIAIGDGVDTGTSSGLNFMTFKLSFNDYYSQDVSNKVRAVKHRKQEKGEYQAPFAPFGYKKDPNNKNHLIIDGEKAEIVKKIFNMYINGIGTPKIAKTLNDENIPSPSKYLETERYKKCSHKWNKGSIYRILKEPVYIGTIVGRKSVKINHKVKNRIKVNKNERIYVENQHEPIIDKQTFEEVQKKLALGTQCRKRKNLNPLKKYIYCGVCGGKATMKTGKRKLKSGEINIYHYFLCNKKSEYYHNCSNGTISSKVLTPIVEKAIKDECSKIVFSKGKLESLYEQAKQNSNNKKNLLTKEITKTEKEINQIDKKVEQVYADKIEGIIKQEDFKKFYNLYQDKKEKAIQKVNILKQELNETKNEKLVSYAHIKKIADECLNMEELKEDLLEKLIDRIEFQGRNIKIKYKFMENK